MTDRTGQLFGNYRLTHLPQLTNEDVVHFRNEARMIAHLEHPHIVQVLDFGVEGDTPFLVMMYAPNGTLRQRHSRGVPLPTELIVDDVKQIASALQFAYQQRLIHRDIKPENMLLGRENEVLLSDFGIALVPPVRALRACSIRARRRAWSVPCPIWPPSKFRAGRHSPAINVRLFERCACHALQSRL